MAPDITRVRRAIAMSTHHKMFLISYVDDVAHAKRQLADGLDGGGAVGSANGSKSVQRMTGAGFIGELGDKEGQPDAAFSCVH